MAKEKINIKLSALILVLAITLAFNQNSFMNSPVFAIVSKSSQQAELVIYTYESLLNDPKYDIEGNFSAYSGIPKDKISIIRFDDANEIVTKLLQEKDNPQADIVIGIDNVLIHKIPSKADVLEKYESKEISNIDSNLIENLDPDKYLLPYDYGIIALYYINTLINKTTNPELENLTLDTLADSDLISKLIVENPKFSSPGLGFLLWTIAVYGDPEINFKGILNKDWKDWWFKVRKNITITKSWGDAFTIFFDEKEGKPFMVSYGTSPAYGFCQWGDNTTSAVVTYENGKPNAWLQIEGIGLVKGAPHKENAKKFIDWFLGKDLQSQIPEHQWMYPANKLATISSCFSQSVIPPDTVNRLNDLITVDMLKQNLDRWIDEWEQVVVLGTIPKKTEEISGFEYITTLLSLFAVVTTITYFTKRRKKKQRY